MSKYDTNFDKALNRAIKPKIVRGAVESAEIPRDAGGATEVNQQQLDVMNEKLKDPKKAKDRT